MRNLKKNLDNLFDVRCEKSIVLRCHMVDKLYYENQNNWDKDDYYYLHRVLHRIFYYNKKYSDEIKSMDVSRMSDRTRVLINCIVRYYGFDYLFDEYTNIKDISKAKPLPESLVLDDEPLPEDNVYRQMNVVY